MSEIDTGGPAFPTRDNDNGYYGMTLRDYFAAKAMQMSMYNGVVFINETVAKRAYEMADAMLKAREG